MPDPEVVRTWLRQRVGYGRLEAPYWFLGMEEGCEDDPREFEIRLQGQHVEDLQTALQRLAPLNSRYRALVQSPPGRQATWDKLLIAFLVATDRPWTKAHRYAYQGEHWGSADSAGETLLAEFLPLPSPSKGHWPEDYRRLAPHIPELATRATYEAAVMAPRVSFFQSLLRAHSPRFVVAYGLGHLVSFKQIFGATTWKPLPVHDAKGWDRAVCGQFGSTKVAIVPHPTAFGGGNAPWQALGNWLRAPSVNPIPQSLVLHAASPRKGGKRFAYTAFFSRPLADSAELIEQVTLFARERDIPAAFHPGGRPFVGMNMRIDLNGVSQTEISEFKAHFHPEHETPIPIIG